MDKPDFSKWPWSCTVTHGLPHVTFEQLYQFFKWRQEKEKREAALEPRRHEKLLAAGIKPRPLHLPDDE